MPKKPCKNKKTIDKHREVLYNGIPYCDSMPFYAILSSVSILAQNMAAVKSEVLWNWQPLRAYHKLHTIRKKGCDDPYGNGQGREVRQDHA